MCAESGGREGNGLWITMVLQACVAASWRGQMMRAEQISRLCHHLIKLHLFANSNPPLCPHLPIPLSPRSKNDKSIEIHLQLNQHTIIHVKIDKEKRKYPFQSFRHSAQSICTGTTFAQLEMLNGLFIMFSTPLHQYMPN